MKKKIGLVLVSLSLLLLVVTQVSAQTLAHYGENSNDGMICWIHNTSGESIEVYTLYSNATVVSGEWTSGSYLQVFSTDRPNSFASWYFVGTTPDSKLILEVAVGDVHKHGEEGGTCDGLLSPVDWYGNWAWSQVPELPQVCDHSNFAVVNFVGSLVGDFGVSYDGVFRWSVDSSGKLVDLQVPGFSDRGQQSLAIESWPQKGDAFLYIDVVVARSGGIFWAEHGFLDSDVSSVDGAFLSRSTEVPQEDPIPESDGSYTKIWLTDDMGQMIVKYMGDTYVGDTTLIKLAVPCEIS